MEKERTIVGIKQFKSYQSALSIALSLGLFLLPATSSAAQARNITASVESRLVMNFEPSDENGDSQPEETLGAGSRNSNSRQCGSQADIQP